MSALGTGLVIRSGLLCLTILAGCGSASSDPPASTGPSPQPSSTATDEPVTSPSPSPDPSTSASAEPTSPPRLASDSWAVVETDTLNLRDGPSLDAKVVGAAGNGRLVYVAGPPTSAGDIPWYPVTAVVAGAARSGWMAAEQGPEVFLAPATGTVKQAWCGGMEAGTTFYGGPGTKLTAVVRFGGLEVPSKLFDPGMQGALAVAWGAIASLCMDLTVAEGEITSVTVPSLVAEACGFGSWGAQGELALSATANPNSIDLGRGFWLYDAMLGFETYPGTNDLPNLGQLVMLSWEGKSEACLAIEASGGIGSTSIDLSLSLVDCVKVMARGESALGLGHWDPVFGVQSTREFDIVAGSAVGPEFEPGALLGATLRSAGGSAGAITVEAADVPDCGPVLVGP